MTHNSASAWTPGALEHPERQQGLHPGHCRCDPRRGRPVDRTRAGEQLYAARFIGNKAYLVTFLQTDPLFAIDLSDPASPTLEGNSSFRDSPTTCSPSGMGSFWESGRNARRERGTRISTPRCSTSATARI